MSRVISACVIAICTLVAGCSDQPQKWPRQAFDPATWAKTPEEDRYVFVRDVIDRDLLRGKKLPEVEAMLGAPSFRSDTEHDVTYVVKAGSKGFNQVYVLDVRFDPTTSAVDTVQVRGD